MPDPKRTQILNAQDPQNIRLASDILSQGGLVGFRTETVYGLGADATNPRAVAGIYAAKGRPSDNPLIIHIADIAQAQRYGVFDDAALLLAQAFWPGPLTLLVPQIKPGHGCDAAKDALAPAVFAGHVMVGLRLPATPSAQALLRACPFPIAAPSANRSGRISPTSAQHVKAELSGQIDAILDDGPCDVGLESTIFDTKTQMILREGAITAHDLEGVLRTPVGVKSVQKDRDMTAPGQMTSHYAPNVSVTLNVTRAQAGQLWLGFGTIGPQDAFNLSLAGDVQEAAHRLYAVLRNADQAALAAKKTIAVAPIPDEGLGRAMNDRLRRAAAPRLEGASKQSPA